MVRDRNKNLKMCHISWRFTESSKLFSLLSEPDQSPDCLWFVCHHFHMCHDYFVKSYPFEKLTPLFGGKLTSHTIKVQGTNESVFIPPMKNLNGLPLLNCSQETVGTRDCQLLSVCCQGKLQKFLAVYQRPLFPVLTCT